MDIAVRITEGHLDVYFSAISGLRRQRFGIHSEQTAGLEVLDARDETFNAALSYLRRDARPGG